MLDEMKNVSEEDRKSLLKYAYIAGFIMIPIVGGTFWLVWFIKSIIWLFTTKVLGIVCLLSLLPIAILIFTLTMFCAYKLKQVSDINIVKWFKNVW